MSMPPNGEYTFGMLTLYALTWSAWPNAVAYRAAATIAFSETGSG
jgi:hypothetical protein